LRQPSFVLFAIGIEISNIDQQIDNGALLFATRPELLGTGSTSWIPTASVDRCYHRMQAFNGCCGSLLSCQRSCCASCWGCVVETDPKSTRHSLFLLFDCAIRTLLVAIASLCRWALDALLLSLLHGAANRLNRLRCSWYYSLLSKSAALFAVASLLTVDCEQRDESIGLIQYNVGKASNTKCYVELMSSSSCFGLARLLCSEAFDFTQCH